MNRARCKMRGVCGTSSKNASTSELVTDGSGRLRGHPGQKRSIKICGSRESPLLPFNPSRSTMSSAESTTGADFDGLPGGWLGMTLPMPSTRQVCSEDGCCCCCCCCCCPISKSPLQLRVVGPEGAGEKLNTPFGDKIEAAASPNSAGSGIDMNGVRPPDSLRSAEVPIDIHMVGAEGVPCGRALKEAPIDCGNPCPCAAADAESMSMKAPGDEAMPVAPKPAPVHGLDDEPGVWPLTPPLAFLASCSSSSAAKSTKIDHNTCVE